MGSRSEESGVNSSFDASGVGQSSLEVSALTGTSEDDERERFSTVLLIACVFCALAFLMVVAMVLFSSDFELYEDTDSGGEDTYKPPIFTRPSSGSGSPAAVTEALTKTTTTERSTKRPPSTNSTYYKSYSQNDYDKESHQESPFATATYYKIHSHDDYNRKKYKAAPLLHRHLLQELQSRRLRQREPPSVPPPPPSPPTRTTIKTTTTKETTKRPPSTSPTSYKNHSHDDYDKENNQITTAGSANKATVNSVHFW
ncbi:hypothetical protein MRX96_028711 [Rhipicephalus microplus]